MHADSFERSRAEIERKHTEGDEKPDAGFATVTITRSIAVSRALRVLNFDKAEETSGETAFRAGTSDDVYIVHDREAANVTPRDSGCISTRRHERFDDSIRDKTADA